MNGICMALLVSQNNAKINKSFSLPPILGTCRTLDAPIRSQCFNNFAITAGPVYRDQAEGVCFLILVLSKIISFKRNLFREHTGDYTKQLKFLF